MVELVGGQVVDEGNFIKDLLTIVVFRVGGDPDGEFLFRAMFIGSETFKSGVL